MPALPSFDELYCISDLHLGGAGKFQIFRQGKLLADFLHHLADLDRDRRIVLVINGDFIDFLAEGPSPGSYLDTVGGVRTLDRVFGDDAFEPALTALAAYVRQDNRFLAITLGNHDLELALPDVSQHLVELLTGGDPAARGRIYLAFDGAGFGARIGASRVLALHGNEADPWNVTHHEALRKVVRDLQRGRKPKPWEPNAGTMLVVDLINEVKRTNPFIDLVKPLLESALPIVIAVRPDLLFKVKKLAKVAKGLTRDLTRSKAGWLGEGSHTTRLDTAYALAESTGARRAATRALVRELLETADRRLAEGIDPVLLADHRYLGWPFPGLPWFHEAVELGTREVLRRALLALLQPSGLSEPDTVYEKLGRGVGSDVDVVLTGHTHEPRAIPRDGGGIYYNSGSWIDRIELTSDDLEHGFEAIYRAFEGGAPLDDIEGLVKRDAKVVHLESPDGYTHVEGRLCSFSPETDPPLPPIANSELSVKGNHGSHTP